MSDTGQQPEAEPAKPRGEAGWRAHLQAVAQSNDRVKAVAKVERREKEERDARQRQMSELRVDAELARKSELRHLS